MQMRLQLSLLYTRQSITVDCVMCVLGAAYKMIRFIGLRPGNRTELFKLIYRVEPRNRVAGYGETNKYNKLFPVSQKSYGLGSNLFKNIR